MNVKEELTKLLMESYDRGVNDAKQEALIALEKVVAVAVAKEREEFAVHAVDIARRAIAEEREACVRRAEIAMLGADRELTLRLITAIRARGQA